jgi:KRAB domain-containing zinc finger protein
MAVTCDICFKVCQCLNDLRVHINSHVKAYRRYCCHLCSETLGAKKYFATHLRCHSDNKNKRHICRWCGRAYAFASELTVHEKVHTVRPFICTVCNTSFASNTAFKHHIVSFHTDKRPFTCKECGETFKQSGRYYSHVFAKHEDKVFACAVCNKKFVVRKTLLNHLSNKHGIAIDKPNSNECSICGKKFVNSRHLNRHKLLHSAERHHCLHCDKSFATSEYVENHMKRMHLVPKPQYQCRHCWKTFNESTNKKRHERDVHGGKYQCDICSAMLSSHDAMKSHLNIHIDCRPHKCKMCALAFVSSTQLWRHVMLHTVRDVTFFHCDICDKLLKHRSTLRKHLERHATTV